jgi:mRNA interferase RelE/StbE
MQVVFDQRFLRDLKKIKNPSQKKQITAAIVKLEEADDLATVQHLRALKGHPSAYRLRVGDYRIGLFLLDDATLDLVRILHRKDIYKKFP